MGAKKTKVVVLYGGKSGEHEVSLRSAASVFQRLDRDRFEVFLVAIDRQGRWFFQKPIRGESFPEVLTVDTHAPQIVLLPGLSSSGAPSSRIHALTGVSLEGLSSDGQVDVIFPVVHGTFCEDGTLQGVLESADAAYVGCGVLASAVGMDKEFAKRLLRDVGIPIVPYLCLRKSEFFSQEKSRILDRVSEFGFPVFIKPANSGSSVGVHRVKSREEILPAMTDAFQYDTKVLIEKSVAAREIELSVLENPQSHQPPLVSVPGEIVPKHSFYSYEAKYLDDSGAELVIPAQLEAKQIQQAQDLARRTFQALDGEGLARVDLFLDRNTGEFFVNEVNTLPGFTSISMYPKLWEHSGLSYKELLTRLVNLAQERYVLKKGLKREFQES